MRSTRWFRPIAAEQVLAVSIEPSPKPITSLETISSLLWITSQANERTDQPAKEAVHAEVARHGHQAEARLFFSDQRLMIERLVSKVEIAGTEPAADMAETALEDAGQLDSAMGVFQHAGAGARFEQERARLSISGQVDWTQADARRDAPAPTDAVVLE